MAGIPALALIVFPLLALPTLTDFSQIWSALQSRETIEAILLSLRTTLVSVGLIAVLGLPLAYYSARSKSWFAGVIDAISDLPIVLPPAAAGVALLAAFGRSGWLGETFNLQVTFTSVAVVIAQVFVAMPYFVRSAAEGIRKVSKEDALAAAIDGAGPWKAAWLVILPQCRGAIGAGILLAWARALGEFGATLMFAGNFVGRTQTVPLAIYAGFEGNLGQAVALSIVLLVLAVIVLAAARLLIRRERS
jgi:molybdate transport system permease protein